MSMGKHFDAEVYACPAGGSVTIQLEAGDSIPWIGKTSGRRVYGPALVRVFRYPDGGLYVQVSDLELPIKFDESSKEQA